MDSTSAPGSSGPDGLLKVRGLYKAFHKSTQTIEVLKEADFDLNKGETVSIMGASGIGKSTLLHILGTLDRPDKGRLLFNNENVLAFPDAKLAVFRNQSIGFVFQFHHLLGDFTAVENVMMPALIQGIGRTDAASMAEKILVRVGLKDRLHHRIGELSGGEQQRVAIARALVLNPIILLADEPTGNLDVKNSRRLHDLLLALNTELGMALVIVTHNPELASYTSRKMTIMEGNLVELN
ncbi:MAG: ABC transporter ATP-binding protein [Desulfobacterales bacterium]